MLESALNKFKKKLQHRCFSVNIAKFLEAPISKNIKALKNVHIEKFIK